MALQFPQTFPDSYRLPVIATDAISRSAALSALAAIPLERHRSSPVDQAQGQDGNRALSRGRVLAIGAYVFFAGVAWTAMSFGHYEAREDRQEFILLPPKRWEDPARTVRSRWKVTLAGIAEFVPSAYRAPTSQLACLAPMMSVNLPMRDSGRLRLWNRVPRREGIPHGSQRSFESRLCFVVGRAVRDGRPRSHATWRARYFTRHMPALPK